MGEVLFPRARRHAPLVVPPDLRRTAVKRDGVSVDQHLERPVALALAASESTAGVHHLRAHALRIAHAELRRQRMVADVQHYAVRTGDRLAVHRQILERHVLRTVRRVYSSRLHQLLAPVRRDADVSHGHAVDEPAAVPLASVLLAVFVVEVDRRQEQPRRIAKPLRRIERRIVRLLQLGGRHRIVALDANVVEQNVRHAPVIDVRHVDRPAHGMNAVAVAEHEPPQMLGAALDAHLERLAPVVPRHAPLERAILTVAVAFMRLETERVVKRAREAVRHPGATAVVQVDAVSVEPPLPDDLHSAYGDILAPPHRYVVEERIAYDDTVYLHVPAVPELEVVPALRVLHRLMAVPARGEEDLLLYPAHVNNAAPENGDVTGAGGVESTVNDRARVEIHRVAALQLPDADVVEARSEHDGVRRRRLLRGRVREHMEVVVVAVELHGVTARPGDVERDRAPLPAEGDVARKRTYLDLLEVACRRHRDRRTAGEREAHHAAQLRLLDLALVSGPPPVERYRRTADFGDGRLLAVDLDRIARIRPFAVRHRIHLRRQARQCRKRRKHPKRRNSGSPPDEPASIYLHAPYSTTNQTRIPARSRRDRNSRAA